MKIYKPLVKASLRIAVAMGIVVCTAAVLTVPAHAKAIGETATKNGGNITVYDDPCPGAENHPDWFLAQANSLADGVTFGCWTVASRTQLRIIWPIETKKGTYEIVPLLYNINGFREPRNL